MITDTRNSYKPLREQQRLYSYFDSATEKFGFINQTGRVVIKPKFDRIEHYSGGFYTVGTRHGNFWSYGYVGRDGFFLAPKYPQSDSFEKGFVNWYMDTNCHVLRNGLVVDNRCIEPQVNGLMILNHSATDDSRHKILNICGQHVFTFPEDVITEPSIKNDDGFTKIDEYGNYYKGWYIEPDGVLTRSKFDGTKQLYLASIDHKLCYIDNDKAVVIDASQYDDAFDFSSGFARVLKNGKYGFLDSTGNTVLPIVFDVCEDFADGSAFFRDMSLEPFSLSQETNSESGHTVYITTIQRAFIRNLPDFLRNSIEDCISFIALHSEFTSVSYSDDTYVLKEDFFEVNDELPDGFLSVTDQSSNDEATWDEQMLNDYCSAILSVFLGYCEAWGKLNTTGKIIVKPQPGPDRYGDGGLFPMDLIVEGKEKSGFINHNWQLCIPTIFDRIEPFQKGVAKVYINRKEGLINTNGDYLVEPQYDHINISTLYPEYLPADNKFYGMREDKLYMFDLSGKILDGMPESSCQELMPGLFLFSDPQDLNRGQGIKDRTGRVICQLGEFHNYERLNDTFATFMDENWAKSLIDKHGNIFKNKYSVIEDCGEGIVFVSEPKREYLLDNAVMRFLIDSDLVRYPLENGLRVHTRFSGGLAGAAVSSGSSNLCGFIDTQGHVVIPCIFEDVRAFHNGMAQVQVNGGWGFMDQDGNFVVPPVLDDICGCFHNGHVWVVYTGKMYDMDTTGRLYDHGLSIEYVSSPIPKKLENRWGYANQDGEFVIPAIYDTAGFFNLDFAKVSQDGWCITIDYEGNVIDA